MKRQTLHRFRIIRPSDGAYYAGMLGRERSWVTSVADAKVFDEHDAARSVASAARCDFEQFEVPRTQAAAFDENDRLRALVSSLTEERDEAVRAKEQQMVELQRGNLISVARDVARATTARMREAVGERLARARRSLDAWYCDDAKGRVDGLEDAVAAIDAATKEGT